MFAISDQLLRDSFRLRPLVVLGARNGAVEPLGVPAPFSFQNKQLPTTMTTIIVYEEIMNAKVLDATKQNRRIMLDTESRWYRWQFDTCQRSD